MMISENLHIGTCSWKYDSWHNIVYSARKPSNYLQEYAKQYNTVEVDQWFWSLFSGNKVALPKASVVREYAKSVPENFRFCIKVPNSLTLTHYYKKAKTDPLIQNPNFLSMELMLQFLESLEPLHSRLGPLIFQFEYLNKQKMAGQAVFRDLLGKFVEKLPKGFMYCVETRNPNYLNTAYFNFLRSMDLHHVFLHGYYMPSIFDVYREYRDQINSSAVIRLHGPDRAEIEKQVGDDWSRIVAPKDRDIAMLAEMVKDLHTRNIEPFIYVNNHFEGSAPRTIARILDTMN